MCKFCKQTNCPQTCPNYGFLLIDQHQRPRRFCRICMGLIPESEAAYRLEKKFICCSCAEELDILDLMRICEIEDRRELISILGFHVD